MSVPSLLQNSKTEGKAAMTRLPGKTTKYPVKEEDEDEKAEGPS